MNTRNAQAQQQGNTMMVKELATAKAQVKKLEAELQALKGKPAQVEVKPPPAPKTKDLVLASNKALREAVALLRRVDVVFKAPSWDALPPGETETLEKAVEAFLALDLDKTVSAPAKKAVVVTRAPAPLVVGVTPQPPRVAGAPAAQPQGAPPVVT